MEVKSTSYNVSGWMVLETEDGSEYLIIGGIKVARKKDKDVYFYVLSIDSMVYRSALMKFLLIAWKEIIKLRDEQMGVGKRKT